MAVEKKSKLLIIVLILYSVMCTCGKQNKGSNEFSAGDTEGIVSEGKGGLVER